LNHFTELTDWLKKQGIHLSEQANVRWAEERMHSGFSNKAEDFRDKTTIPLIKKIEKTGFTLGQVAEVAHAQHAPEYNAQVAKINPAMPDGGSGMTNAEARAILAQASLPLKALSNELRAITDETLKLLLDAGLLSPEEVDHYRAAYRYYVPLKGGPEEKAARTGSGKGLSVNHSQKRALGHKQRADEQIAQNIWRDRERALMEAEKTSWRNIS
jgi:hypothetical protein